MADLATLITQRDALQVAIARGVQRVEYDGRSVTYQSAGDLLRAITSLNAQIGILEGGRVTDVRIWTSRG